MSTPCVIINAVTLWQVLGAVTDARGPGVGYSVADEWPGLGHNSSVCHDLSTDKRHKKNILICTEKEGNNVYICYPYFFKAAFM